MKEFAYIPRELWPDPSTHIAYDPVYRAVKSDNCLTENDFLPWNIEHINQIKLFGKQCKQPVYGMSVFTDLKSLVAKIQTFPVLKKSTKSIAKGFTSISRGISTKETGDHHVEYFLYDYVNNNPKDDFAIYVSADEATRMVNKNE